MILALLGFLSCFLMQSKASSGTWFFKEQIVEATFWNEDIKHQQQTKVFSPK
jgi:hypothetical protein